MVFHSGYSTLYIYYSHRTHAHAFLGRLAMVACVGFLVQEALHPLHSEIGGMAVTHMQQVRY
jgi:hypothetical protein